MAAVFHNGNDEFETKSSWIQRKLPGITKLLTLKTKSFCFQHTLNDTNSDPETWIAFPYQKQSQGTSALARKLAAGSSLTNNKPTPPTRRRRNLSSKNTGIDPSCIDPSASEEHGLHENKEEEYVDTTVFPLPARSLFSAHEEVISAFSSGQRLLQQRMSALQRRASIAEAQRERQAHIEILEQHFGRRFLRKAMTIVEENENEDNWKFDSTPPLVAVAVDAGASNSDGQQSSSTRENTVVIPDKFGLSNEQQELKIIYAEAFITTATIASSSSSLSSSYSSNGSSSSSFLLQHSAFAVHARRTSTEDLETELASVV